MWRGHQVALQSTVQRWMLRRHHTQVGGYRLLSSSRCYGGVASFADKILQPPPLLPRNDGSLVKYGDVNQRRCNNNLIISCHAFSTRGRNGPRGPDMRGLQSVEEVIMTAHEHLHDMSRRDVSAFWTCISKLMTKRQPKHRSNSSNQGDLSIDDMRHMMYAIYDDTT